MADNQAADEIDLGQLLGLIKKGLNQIGNFFLKVFLFLKNNFLKLVALVVLGVAAGFALNNWVSEKYKTEVLVRPNFESKNYLYDVVEEIKQNLKSSNTEFIEALGFKEDDLKDFEIEIEAIEEESLEGEEALAEQTKYLEVLRNFKDESFVIDILKSELSEKSIVNHKIIFKYKGESNDDEIVNKIINYINKNDYFEGLRKINSENAISRIAENKALINQIDNLISDYSKALTTSSKKQDANMVYMEKENLNVPSLLNLKNEFIAEIENKNYELVQQNEVISILNIGKSQKIEKPLFNESYAFLPALFLLAFFIFSLFSYINKRAIALQQQYD